MSEEWEREVIDRLARLEMGLQGLSKALDKLESEFTSRDKIGEENSIRLDRLEQINKHPQLGNIAGGSLVAALMAGLVAFMKAMGWL